MVSRIPGFCKVVHMKGWKVSLKEGRTVTCCVRTSVPLVPIFSALWQALMLFNQGFPKRLLFLGQKC